MRTQTERDGTPPVRTNNWCHAGGETNEFGGAVIWHVVPEQVNAGKRVRWPNELPCVEDSAPMREKRTVPPLGLVKETE